MSRSIGPRRLPPLPTSCGILRLFSFAYLPDLVCSRAEFRDSSASRRHDLQPAAVRVRAVVHRFAPRPPQPPRVHGDPPARRSGRDPVPVRSESRRRVEFDFTLWINDNNFGDPDECKIWGTSRGGCDNNPTRGTPPATSTPTTLSSTPIGSSRSACRRGVRHKSAPAPNLSWWSRIVGGTGTSPRTAPTN